MLGVEEKIHLGIISNLGTEGFGFLGGVDGTAVAIFAVSSLRFGAWLLWAFSFCEAWGSELQFKPAFSNTLGRGP